jgi:hypothetical protein
MSNAQHAQEMWAGMDHEKRKGVIDALKKVDGIGDHAKDEHVGCDYAALPPEVQGGIIAGMVPEAPAEASSEDESEDHSSRRRRRGSDD